MKQGTLPFTKMHGAGNDFVVLNNLSGQLVLNAELIQRLAHRHFGIGADQILIVEPATNPNNDFKYRIFNANGQEVQQCGNGARCFAVYVYHKKLTSKKKILVETLAGVISPEVKSDDLVQVDMGLVSFNPKKLPFEATGLRTQTVGQLEQYSLESNTMRGLESYWGGIVSVGNPHLVFVLPACPSDDQVQQVGQFFEKNPRFPEGVNVGFMVVIDSKNIQLRVFERGVGETLACGTGACAAVATGIRMGVLSNTVQVHKLGGVLEIHWDGNLSTSVLMTGGAQMVFEGEFIL